MRQNHGVSYLFLRLKFGDLANVSVGMNCEKNAVVCEGYPEKQLWKSGKERAEEGEQGARTALLRRDLL
jgi:hypothetical protein